MIRLFRRAQKTANIAPPTRHIPRMPKAMPDIHDDAQPLVAGSLLKKMLCYENCFYT